VAVAVIRVEAYPVLQEALPLKPSCQKHEGKKISDFIRDHPQKKLESPDFLNRLEDRIALQ
jgi:hypothetical protein